MQLGQCESCLRSWHAFRQSAKKREHLGENIIIFVVVTVTRYHSRYIPGRVESSCKVGYQSIISHFSRGLQTFV